MRLHMEIALAGILFVALLVVLLSPRSFMQRDNRDMQLIEVPFAIEQVPVTKQGLRKPPPRPTQPAIPIEVEFELEMDDVTIDFVDANLFDLPDMPEGFGLTSRQVAVIPRLIREVIPAVSDEIKRRGVRGEIKMSILVNDEGRVKDVDILRNTTSVESYIKTQRLPDDEIDRIYQALPAVQTLFADKNPAPETDAQLISIFQKFGVSNAAKLAESVRVNWKFSLDIAKSAVDAQFKTGYIPGRKGEESVAQRIIRTVKIDYGKH